MILVTGARSDQLRLWLPIVPLLLFLGALALDGLGISHANAQLWTLGSRAALIGLIVGGLVLIAQAVAWRPGKWPTGLSLLGLLLLALARWLRGDEAVPPEPILLWVQAFGISALFAAALIAHRTANSQAVSQKE